MHRKLFTKSMCLSSLCNRSYFTCLCFNYADAILTFSASKYLVNENDGPVSPILVLNVPATVPFTVQIESSNVDLSGEW